VISRTGQTFEYTLQERAEDFLTQVFKQHRDLGRQDIAEVCEKQEITEAELRHIIKYLQENHLIYRPEESDGKSSVKDLETLPRENLKEEQAELRFTDYGYEYAEKLIQKNDSLVALLKMVSNADESIVRDDVSRIEHVVSDATIQGIEAFIQSGQPNNRVIKDRDLNFFYEKGNYKFAVCLYEPNTHYPRKLSKENSSIENMIEVKIANSGSSMLLHKKKNAELKKPIMWYSYNRQWVRAVATRRGYKLPTSVFTYTICAALPVREGNVVVGFTKDRERVPEDRDIRELSVHLW